MNEGKKQKKNPWSRKRKREKSKRIIKEKKQREGKN